MASGIISSLNTEPDVPTPPVVPVLVLKPKGQPLTGRHAVVAFMRCQPPTRGHARVIEKMVQVARERRADPVLFASVKQDKVNPLPFLEKTGFLKRLFPQVIVSLHDGVKTPITMLAALSLLKYDAVTVIVGSDRKADFEKFTKYIKRTGVRGTDIVLQDYDVVTVDRDPDSDDVEGLSATKMRQYALDGDWNAFFAGTPTENMALAKQIYKRLRSVMGLKS